MNLPYGCIMVAVNESSRKVILDCMKTSSLPAASPSSTNRSRGSSSSSGSSQTYTHSQLQRLSASMLSGAVAGAVAALLTTPLDVIKTRLQTQNLVSQTLGNSPLAASPLPLACPGFVQARRHLASSSTSTSGGVGAGAGGGSRVEVVVHRYRSMGQTFRSVVAEEGYISLLRGAVPRILVHAPSVAISWTAYEFAKSILAGGK
jgi:solute carrier family 25 (mitochondrial iron transporter), member 28/37